MSEVYTVAITVNKKRVPMLSTEQELYTTMPVVAGLLETTEKNLIHIRSRAPWKFQDRMTPEELDPILTFLRENELQEVGTDVSIVSMFDLIVYSGSVNNETSQKIYREFIAKAFQPDTEESTLLNRN